MSILLMNNLLLADMLDDAITNMSPDNQFVLILVAMGASRE